MPTKVNRRRPRQARAQATVETILEAAAQILVREGYEKMSTNAVAKRAGVSVGSLYQYFSNKKALCVALIEAHLQAMAQAVDLDDVDTAGQPLQDVARDLISRLIQVHRVNPPLQRALVELTPRLGLDGAQVALTAGTVQRVQAWLIAHPKQVRSDADPMLAAWLTSHAVEAVVMQLCRYPEAYDADVVIAETTRMVVGYLSA